MAKAKKWYEVTCPKHGSVDSGDSQNIRRVTVGTPKSKRERRSGGCPACKSEVRNEKGTP